jgi:hypothetical protein
LSTFYFLIGSLNFLPMNIEAIVIEDSQESSVELFVIADIKEECLCMAFYS